MPDNEKINRLKELLSLVVDNTKKEANGKAGQVSKERAALARTLSDLIGRKATKEELSLFGA